MFDIWMPGLDLAGKYSIFAIPLLVWAMLELFSRIVLRRRVYP